MARDTSTDGDFECFNFGAIELTASKPKGVLCLTCLGCILWKLFKEVHPWGRRHTLCLSIRRPELGAAKQVQHPSCFIASEVNLRCASSRLTFTNTDAVKTHVKPTRSIRATTQLVRPNNNFVRI
eukprot:GHVN01064281.1.p1 GENE.GHVN01064281.1~~GHVN01064281.1.p1  ORF type:complete len:125 (+),score=6.52 GHVN01064281.1:651-1025(+)